MIIYNVSGTEKALEGLVPLSISQVCRQVSGVPSTYYSLIFVLRVCVSLGCPRNQRGAADKQNTLTLFIRQSGLGRVTSLDVMGRCIAAVVARLAIVGLMN